MVDVTFSGLLKLYRGIVIEMVKCFCIRLGEEYPIAGFLPWLENVACSNLRAISSAKKGHAHASSTFRRADGAVKVLHALLQLRAWSPHNANRSSGVISGFCFAASSIARDLAGMLFHFFYAKVCWHYFHCLQ